MPRGDGAARLYIEVERCAPPDGDGESPTGLIRVEGELDLETVDQLADSLDPKLWPGCDGLLIDLSGVRFMDSSGISLLVRANRELREAGLRFAVTSSPRSQVEGVLELTGVREWLPAAL